MLTAQDLKQLEKKGIAKEQIDDQVSDFKAGFPFMELKRAAVIGDGILALSEKDIEEKIKVYDSYTGSVLKFVPASGAASRMFKSLFTFLEEAATKPDCIHSDQFSDVKMVVDNIHLFAFYNEIKSAADTGDPIKIVEAILAESGLNYGQLPKGLLLFHSYNELNRTALEEHLVEGALYAKTSDNKVAIHFTVSPEHMDGFKSKVRQVIPDYESKFDVKYEISYSIQKSSTDTLAVDLANKPFREDDGTLLFRPGGHGALLANLNDLSEDLIFIKNIDNVVPDQHKAVTVKYKKALAGVLLDIRNHVFDYLNKLDKSVSNELLTEVYEFTCKKLCLEVPGDFDHLSGFEKVEILQSLLNRPMRVCGIVKNEGEPGGGPFWATNGEGIVSLQVVEQAQMNSKDKEQQEIVQKATHFNPVDLVCYTKDRHGKKFDLMDYRDPKTGFISKKSKNGKELKAMELPGLWNGAMANWITLFVEVPVKTFNPVKTINDLLRDMHQ